MHPKIIDAGSILLQDTFDIPDQIKYPELEDELAELGGKLAATVIKDFDYYWKNKTAQADVGISSSKKISKSDGIISFKLDSFETINRKIRALIHQIPIKTVDLIPNKQVLLEDILLDLPLNFTSTNTNSNTSVYYDKSIKAVLFPVQNGTIGVKRFKIEGKSQIFPAGSFYSNYLKNI